MSDRNPVCRSGQNTPSMSSVTMEDRNVLRRMERERRSQEVQQKETQYDRIAPLFSEPFKRIRGDELSSRIQSMLGNYEDGSDEFPVSCLELDGPPALGPPALGLPALGLPALGLPALGPPALGLPALGPPALGPPVLPLSPLPASDSSSSPDLSIHRLTLNLPCKLANAKKPTAYVRPMDGHDQVTSDSPRLKASLECLQDLKESSEPSLSPLQSVDVVSGKRAEDVLQEMTSWPTLLMSICTPSSAEPPKVLNTNEESHGFTALKAHESSDGVQLEPQVGSGSSSDSDSSSDTDSENNRSPDQPAAHEQSNTQAESDEKFQKKKQKLDVEGKKFISSQQSLHQSEASRSSETTMMMKKKRKKSTKHGSGVPQETWRDAGHKRRSDSQLRKAEAHGKKPFKSRSVFPEEPRPPTAEAHRPRSVEDHMKDAKKLKHKADATLDKMAKALCYLEAALAFVESAIAMETEPETPKSAYTMFSETLDLIRFILKLKNYTDPSATAQETDFFILCLRCQSLLQMAMFRYRRDSALGYSRTLADHFRSSSWSASPSVSKITVASPMSSGSGSLVVPQHIQQAAASYVSITTLFLSAHETWEQADDLMTLGSGLLRELDSSVTPLSLTASMISLVTYIRLGLHRIRRDTQNQNQNQL